MSKPETTDSNPRNKSTGAAAKNFELYAEKELDSLISRLDDGTISTISIVLAEMLKRLRKLERQNGQ